jgi:uncharacterized repeat protein (TIGR03803 family)
MSSPRALFDAPQDAASAYVLCQSSQAMSDAAAANGARIRPVAHWVVAPDTGLATSPIPEHTMIQASTRIATSRQCWKARVIAACWLASGLLVANLAVSATPAAKALPLQAYSMIHRFAHGEGWGPSSNLVQDKHGNLFGANRSSSQGFWFAPYQRGCGLIYRIAPDGTESTAHDFSDQKATRGCYVGGELLLEQGAMYGAAGGGKYGFGVVWRLSFNGHYQVLHHFVQDEAEGTSGVIRGPDGALYGTSAHGGKNHGPNGETYGTVFRLDAEGGLTVVYNFHQADPLGARPSRGLTLGADGLLYGTADDGAGSGTVFRVEASGQLSLVVRSINTMTYQATPRSNLFQRKTTGVALNSAMPLRMRCLSSSTDLTRMCRRNVRAILEKAHSIRLSQEPCLGV